MDPSRSTCWTMIRSASDGAAADRDEFARRYAPLIRAYLANRWKNSSLSAEVEDALQEVFVECFRNQGALEGVAPSASHSFRSYLYGVVRNVARRAEQRAAKQRERTGSGSTTPHLDALPADEETLSREFDRNWAQSVLREASELMRRHAEQNGTETSRRWDLLRLRFQNGMPIREIAKQWEEDPAKLHHDYARARQEFKDALLEVLAFYHPGAPAAAKREAEELISLL